MSGIASPAMIPSRRPIARKRIAMIMNTVVMPFLVRVLRSFLMNWALSFEMTTSVFNGIIWLSLSSASFVSRSSTIVIVFPPFFLIVVNETAFFGASPWVEIRERVFLVVVPVSMVAMSFKSRLALGPALPPGMLLPRTISPSSWGVLIWLSNLNE